MYNAFEVRNQFPALTQKVNGHDLIYLDSAATTLKPQIVIDRINRFYSYEAANVHRGAHTLSDQATASFESARESIRHFINAPSSDEIIFTKGTTESINLLAYSYGMHFLNEGDEIVLTELEHHSNIVAWQILAEKKKCVLKYIKVTDTGELDLISLNEMITAQTKLVAFSGCSNILGTLTPLELIIQKAQSVGAITFLDAAQLVTQKKIDVQKLNVDFLAFSAHKLFGPFGFGVLYGRKSLLEKMPPYQGGGAMISKVEFSHSTYNQVPFKFEAGTPSIEAALATETAIRFFTDLKIDEVFKHEQNLLKQTEKELLQIEGLKIFGQASDKAAILSFNIAGIHHSDIGQILDQQGVAVRVGHHCTQPLLKKFSLTGTVRASISIYNNEQDMHQFIEAVKKAKRMLT